MPLPSSNYQAMFPLQEVILGKDDGLPLANGIVTFYEDSSRSPPLTKKAIYQALTKSEYHVSLITLFFVNNPNSLGYKAFVFLCVKQNYFNEFTG